MSTGFFDDGFILSSGYHDNHITLLFTPSIISLRPQFDQIQMSCNPLFRHVFILLVTKSTMIHYILDFVYEKLQYLAMIYFRSFSAHKRNGAKSGGVALVKSMIMLHHWTIFYSTVLDNLLFNLLYPLSGVNNCTLNSTQCILI